MTIVSLKYDGRINYSWSGTVCYVGSDLVVVRGLFDRKVRSALLTFEPGSLTLEYYWFDKWYNVISDFGQKGYLQAHYCNIALPARFEEEQITFIDLDIDILVRPDLSYLILDEEEFERHAAQFNYPLEIRQGVQMAIAELLERIGRKESPFQDREISVAEKRLRL
ncbi:MAG: DUF402 domain-containing protein [Chloroflexi bacterium]|nr:DUF402 domain-containing protein [Chloroflexota bacterium]MCL5075915.1 DUF402 domain-containing protein [Chloroflexota bacterium]